MSLKLMYITNNPEVAKLAEKAGVDRIWIDLEKNGKEARQSGMNSVKSNHELEDITRLRPIVKKAELMVRVNPIFEGSEAEISEVVSRGADLIMLPMFKTADEVKAFIKYVNKQAKVMLLMETAEAYENLEEIVKIPGIDEIHIGLNDLHLSYGMNFMFEPLANGMVDRACEIIKKAGIPYGFGGVAKLGEGLLPAENVIAEHYRLGSSMVILSRSFCDTTHSVDTEAVIKTFIDGVNAIRNYEKTLLEKDEAFFVENRRISQEKIAEIAEIIERKKKG